MKVMTYNIKGLHLSGRAAEAVVRSAGPDVLAIEEPPRGLFGPWRMRRFGRAVGLTPVVSGHGARTTALLVRDLPVHGAHAVRLSWRPGTTRRGVSVAVVGDLTFVVVHLSLVRTERAEHVERLLASVVPKRRTVVLGDLNEPPSGPAWARFAEHLGSPPAPTGPTFPAVGAVQRIDAVFATPDVVVGPAAVLESPAVEAGSDHRPIVVELR